MSNRRGWQFASVAGLWLTYGSFMLWPTLNAHIGKHTYVLPLAVLVVALGWATVAAWRAIVASHPPLIHWEARLLVDSLFILLLTVDLFALDLLAVFATQHALADAPFAQVGWAALIVSGVAALFAIVGGFGVAALNTPMPAPGGYRDAPNSAVDQSFQPPASEVPKSKDMLSAMSPQDGIRQLCIIGIVVAMLFLFFTPFPIWLPTFGVTIAVTWALWHNIAIFPVTMPTKLSRFIAWFFVVTGCVLVVILYGFVSYDATDPSHIDVSETLFLMSWGLAMVILLLGFDNYAQALQQGQSQPSALLFHFQSLLGLQLIYFGLLTHPFRHLDVPWFQNVLLILGFGLLALHIGLHVIASIRALRTPTQPEVAA